MKTSIALAFTAACFLAGPAEADSAAGMSQSDCATQIGPLYGVLVAEFSDQPFDFLRALRLFPMIGDVGMSMPNGRSPCWENGVDLVPQTGEYSRP